MNQCVREDLINKNDQSYKSFDKNNTQKPGRKGYSTGIIYSILAFLVTFILGLALSGSLIKALEAQAPYVIKFINLAPDEIVITSLKVALLTALYFVSPYVLYQLIMPKLRTYGTSDKKFVISMITGGFLLCTCGILFAYYAIIPAALLILFGINGDLATASFSISKYISFCLQLILISAAAFEFPIFLILLAKTNLISYKKLSASWKKVAIGAFIASVILTSSELFTMLFLTGIILFIYGLAVATTKAVEKYL